MMKWRLGTDGESKVLAIGYGRPTIRSSFLDAVVAASEFEFHVVVDLAVICPVDEISGLTETGGCSNDHIGLCQDDAKILLIIFDLLIFDLLLGAFEVVPAEVLGEILEQAPFPGTDFASLFIFAGLLITAGEVSGLQDDYALTDLRQTAESSATVVVAVELAIALDMTTQRGSLANGQDAKVSGDDPVHVPDPSLGNDR